MKKMSDSTQRYDNLKERISGLILRKMQKLNVTGVSIALVDDQEIVWAEGFGFSDRENGIKATPGMTCNICSISKLFTGTAIMQLAEQGKIDIDKPVTEYIQEFKINTRFKDSRPITVKDLMIHHSGIPSSRSKGMWAENVEPFQTVLRDLKDDYVAYPPGYIYAYSNMAYSVLGVVLERASGQDYYHYMRKNILDRIGMNNSSFFVDDVKDFLAKTYNNGKPERELPLRDIPGGGLHSNVLDMSLFMKMVNAGGCAGKEKIIEKDTLDYMLQPQNRGILLDLGNDIGLSWHINLPSLNYAGKVAFHNGAVLCYRSVLIMLPYHKLGVVLLSNSGNSMPLIQEAAEETLKQALFIKKGIKPPVKKKATAAGNMTLDKSILKYAGDYATNIGLVSIKESKGLPEGFINGRKYKLIPDGQCSFRLKNAKISFSEIEGKKILAINNAASGEEYVRKEVPSIWKERTGVYEAVNISKEEMTCYLINRMEIALKDGILYMTRVHGNKAKSTLVISPVTDNEAIIMGLGRSMRETVYVKKAGEKEVLEYSGIQYQKL